MRPTYLAVFLAILGTGMGLPVPEDASVLTSGALGGTGDLAWGPLFGTCMVAVLLGDLFLYGVGYSLGRGVIASRLLSRVFPQERVRRGEEMFARHGDAAIVVARFVMGVRAIVFVAAGALGRPIMRVLVVDAVAALVYVPLLLVAGKLAGSRLDRVTAAMEHGRVISLVALVIVATAAFSVPRLVSAIRQRKAK